MLELDRLGAAVRKLHPALAVRHIVVERPFPNVEAPLAIVEGLAGAVPPALKPAADVAAALAVPAFATNVGDGKPKSNNNSFELRMHLQASDDDEREACRLRQMRQV